MNDCDFTNIDSTDADSTLIQRDGPRHRLERQSMRASPARRRPPISLPGLRSTIRRIVLAIALSVIFGGLPSPTAGNLEDLAGEPAIQAAEKGLRQDAAPPWYDASKDALRPLQLREKAKTKESRTWTAKPKRPRKKRTMNWGGWSFFNGLSTAWRISIYGLLIALLVIACYVFIRSGGFKRIFQTDPPEAQRDTRDDDERMENLPFTIERPKDNLLDEARRLYQLGRYGEALVYLFSYQLLQMDKNQQIRLTKGKTNRQYLREISRRKGLRRVFKTTMILFEEFFFGHHTVERERFESCWNQLDEFHALVKAEVGS